MTRCALHAFILLFALSGALSRTVEAAWVHEKTEGTLLHFVDDQSKKSLKLKTGVRNLQFHGVLTDGASGRPYALYSGLPCEKCGSEQMTVFINRLDGSGAPFQFVYPGEIRDPKKGVVYKARAFYGSCLPNVKSGYVVHQSELVDRRGTQRSVLIAEPGPEKVDDKLIETRRQPSLQSTEALVRKKECFEIPGRSRMVLKRNLEAGSSPVADSDEDDEDVDQSDEKSTETPATLEPPEATDEAPAEEAGKTPSAPSAPAPKASGAAPKAKI